MYFPYGEKEINYLKSKDKKLCDFIEKRGHINRNINLDLFENLIYTIIGQQISLSSQNSICKKFNENIGVISIENINNTNVEHLKAQGISLKKAKCIKDLTDFILLNKVDISKFSTKNNEEIIKILTTIKGIGIWTAEMILIFSLQRKDVISYSDFGIKKGLCILYNHEKINKNLFNKYRELFSPYNTIASFYLWEIANNYS